jgi:serine/threonine protein kinase
MSPEQRRGTAATPTSDLFSVGIVMLRLLTGARELGLRQKPSSLRPGVHPGWDSVILRAIRENPQARHPSAEEMAHDIEEIPVGR